MKETPPYTVSQAVAMQALAKGDATPEQQKMAIAWIQNEVCVLPFWAYKEGQRETDVMLGRQFVGHRLHAAITANISKLTAAWAAVDKRREPHA